MENKNTYVYGQIKLDHKGNFKFLRLYIGNIGSYPKYIDFTKTNMKKSYELSDFDFNYETGHINIQTLKVTKIK